MLDMAPASPRPASRPKVNLRQIALPTEHGSWGFLFEPIAAALAIAFSASGTWIALVVIGAFLARRPFQVLAFQRQAGRRPVKIAALKFLLGYGLVAILGLIGAVLTGGPYVLLPFAIVAPVAAFQLYIEITQRGRQLVAELAGALIMPSSAAAIIYAGGSGWLPGVMIWLLFGARFVPSILYVRSRLDLEKGKSNSAVAPFAAHFVALSMIAAASFSGLLPLLPVVVFGLLLIRCWVGLSRYRRRIKAMKIGVWEVVYGALVVASLIVGHYAGW